MDAFVDRYRLVELSREARTGVDPSCLIGCRRNRTGFTALVRTEDAASLPVPAVRADLDSIMVHLEGRESE